MLLLLTLTIVLGSDGGTTAGASDRSVDEEAEVTRAAVAEYAELFRQPACRDAFKSAFEGATVRQGLKRSLEACRAAYCPLLPADAKPRICDEGVPARVGSEFLLRWVEFTHAALDHDHGLRVDALVGESWIRIEAAAAELRAKEPQIVLELRSIPGHVRVVAKDSAGVPKSSWKIKGDRFDRGSLESVIKAMRAQGGGSLKDARVTIEAHRQLKFAALRAPLQRLKEEGACVCVELFTNDPDDGEAVKERGSPQSPDLKKP